MFASGVRRGGGFLSIVTTNNWRSPHLIRNSGCVASFIQNPRCVASFSRKRTSVLTTPTRPLFMRFAFFFPHQHNEHGNRRKIRKSPNLPFHGEPNNISLLTKTEIMVRRSSQMPCRAFSLSQQQGVLLLQEARHFILKLIRRINAPNRRLEAVHAAHEARREHQVKVRPRCLLHCSAPDILRRTSSSICEWICREQLRRSSRVAT